MGLLIDYVLSVFGSEKAKQRLAARLFPLAGMAYRQAVTLNPPVPVTATCGSHKWDAEIWTLADGVTRVVRPLECPQCKRPGTSTVPRGHNIPAGGL